jgi:PadR family transcriptional regulator, regulatory protein PadR
MSDNESIGLLEEMILLIVLKNSDINGAEVLRHYENLFNRSISLPAVIAVLKRLEKKGFLKSKTGEATRERGGKRKNLYRATSNGFKIAAMIQSNRNHLWSEISFAVG